MGHSDQEIGDLYSKMEEEAKFCQAVTESVGFGFELGEGKTGGTGDVAPIAAKTHLEELSDLQVFCEKWSGRKNLNLQPPGPEPMAT